MAFDLLITNAKICDGTGIPSFSGNVAISQGKIAALGKFEGTAKLQIDAAGQVVAPGFIDPHTHYDAQVSWDPLLTSACWHGITTVLMGNCGVGVAPCRPDQRSILAWDLVNVESIPHDVLVKGVDWSWETFPEYMNAIDQRQMALNTAFLVPLSALRFYVLGADASTRIARPDEIRKMVDLLREALKAGAFGLSMSFIPRHMGYQGQPLASLVASDEELTALCNAMRDMNRGCLEVALLKTVGVMTEWELNRLLLLARESRRPVTWLGLINVPGQPSGSLMSILDRLRPYSSEGLRISAQISPRPIRTYYDLRTPMLCGEMPSWKGAFNFAGSGPKTWRQSAAHSLTGSGTS
jgi:N-acyl-D-amino-acid deacylase